MQRDTDGSFSGWGPVVFTPSHVIEGCSVRRDEKTETDDCRRCNAEKRAARMPKTSIERRSDHETRRRTDERSGSNPGQEFDPPVR